MKQGTGNSAAGARKIEPRGENHSPAAIAEIGIHEVRTVPAPGPVAVGGRAPKMDITVHETGSQGKH